MAEYKCRNYGNCAYADDRKTFTLPDSGTPACPGCGRSDTLKQVAGGGGGGLPKAVLAVVAVLIMAALAWGGWQAFRSTSGPAPVSGKDNPPPVADNRQDRAPPPVSPDQEATKPEPFPVKLDEDPRDSPVPASNPPPAGTGDAKLYGIIEIGGKGVRGAVVDLVNAEIKPDCNVDEEAFAKCLIRYTAAAHNVTPINPGSIDDTVRAVQAILDKIQNEYTVPSGQIYLVGSSSVARAAHSERLKEAVENALNRKFRLAYVTPDEEARHGFNGVLYMIPGKYRALRKTQTVVLDVGSGNTKGAYMETRADGESELISFDFTWGTKTFSDEIDKQRGEGSFKDYSTRLRNTLLRPAIREVVDRKQGLVNHSRLYLIGGIAWTLTNLTQPQNRQRFPRIYPAQFDTLYARTIAPNATRRLCMENPDRAVNRDVEQICNTFTTDDMTAGMDLLKTIAEEIKMKEKTVFFIRDSLYAWPLAYLKTQCGARCGAALQ
jgi:hypothetical protein